MKRTAVALVAVLGLVAVAALLWPSVRQVFDLNPESKKPGIRNGEVRVYNWTHYIADEVVTAFKEHTGIDVVYANYSSNEDMFARVGDGGSGYDIVFPSDYMVAIMARRDLLATIERDRLRNYDNLDPEILKQAEGFDPGNKFAVPYMWGTVGIGYDSAHLDTPPSSLADVLHENLRGRISMIDDERFGLGAVLKHLGYSANTTQEGELNEAVEWLLTLKPYLLSVDSEKYMEDLEAERAWVAIGFSGDIAQVAESRPSVKYAIPQNGAVLWIDNMVILRDAPNKENAHVFIDFLLDARNGARISNVIRYASANRAARDAGMDMDLLADRSVFPPTSVMERSEALRDLDNANALYTKAWLTFLSRSGAPLALSIADAGAGLERNTGPSVR